MEIEKTRETSWKIQLKNNQENIEVTSVEISGIVQKIRLALLKEEHSVELEMSKEEFFNFLSLISAFKDVVIGEDSFLREESRMEEVETDFHHEHSENDEVFQITPESSEEQLESKEEEHLNPEEWDPW